MNQHPRVAVILAAGEGKRMTQGMTQAIPKVLVPLAGKPMLAYVVEHLQSAGFATVIVVVGFGKEQVHSWLKQEYGADSLFPAQSSMLTLAPELALEPEPKPELGSPPMPTVATTTATTADTPLRIYTVVQENQLGTANALMAAKPLLAGYAGDFLVICGDMPFISGKNLRAFYDFHLGFHEQQGENRHSHHNGAQLQSGTVEEAVASSASSVSSASSAGAPLAMSVLSAVIAHPKGYGRIIRSPLNQLERIREEKDANAQEKNIQEVNSGTYVLPSPSVFHHLQKVGNHNKQAEFYLTDLVQIYRQAGENVGVYKLSENDSMQIQGINTQAERARAEELLLQGSNR